MLAKRQGEALDKAGMDRPPALGQHRLDSRCRAEEDAVLHPHDAPPSVGLHHLRREQPGQGPPAWLGPWPLDLATLGVPPLPVVRDQRREVLPKAVREK
jgi:hypothetical protein